MARAAAPDPPRQASPPASPHASADAPRLAAVALVAAGTALVLAAARPSPAGPLGRWTGDELAAKAAWAGALLGSCWLAASATACLATALLSRGRAGRRAAARGTAGEPGGWRAAVRVVVFGAWLLVPAPAGASAPRARGPAPPVVRAPATVTATRPTAPAAPAAALVVAAPVVAARGVAPRVHLVRPGENLWRIAADELRRRNGSAAASSADVARYWRLVVAANESTLRSGDPSLIYPGEAVLLPGA